MKHIYVVGLGGIGSAIISPLGKFLKYYNKDFWEIFLIDGDTIEENNLQRQNYIPTDIGLGKSVIMKQYLSSIVDCNVVSIQEYLTDKNIDIKDDSIIFVCVDNYITRELIEDYCIKKLKNVLIIFGGNEYADGDVNIVYIKNGKLKTPKYSEKHPEIKEKRDKFPDDLTCAEASASFPQLIFANMTAAQLMLNSFYSWIKNNKIKIHEFFFSVKDNAIRGVLNERKSK